MLQRLIDDMNKALSANCYLAALSIALMLPDICGKAEYPDLKVGERYKAWYEEFVGKYEIPPVPEGWPDDTKMPYLSGEVVYSLRNFFLHQGTPNIEPQKIKAEENKIDKFALVIESKNEFDIYSDASGIWNGSIRTYRVNVRRLCLIMGANASAYYEDNKTKVLIDKDCRIKRDIVPTDIDYHVRKPSAREYDDCCNEFWNVTPYVIKGLCRKEILFAIDHFNQIVRHELLRMISWKVGIETGFKLSVGKNYKFIERYISEDLWEKLLSTYRMDSYENIWEALFLCHQLFRAVSGEVAERLHYAYPEYDRNITKYTRDMYKKYTGKTGCLDSTYAADIEERREQ